MKKCLLTITFLFSFAFSLQALDLTSHNQLILVLAKDWSSVQAKMYTYERSDENEPWLLVEGETDVVLGKNGLGWSYCKIRWQNLRLGRL